MFYYIRNHIKKIRLTPFNIAIAIAESEIPKTKFHNIKFDYHEFFYF